MKRRTFLTAIGLAPLAAALKGKADPPAEPPEARPWRVVKVPNDMPDHVRQALVEQLEGIGFEGPERSWRTQTFEPGLKFEDATPAHMRREPWVRDGEIPVKDDKGRPIGTVTSIEPDGKVWVQE